MRVRSDCLLLLVLGIVFAVPAASPTAASQDRKSFNQPVVLGTWILDVQKSKFHPGPAPRSQRRVYEKHPEGVKVTINTVAADGSSSTAEYVTRDDSVGYPITGISGWDAVKLKKVGDYTAEAILTHAGTEVGTARRVVSPDGKTMTITFQSNLDGRLVENEAFYEKQKQ